MVDDPLAEPVAMLLTLGEPKYLREFEWPDYQSFGIGPEHISHLIRIATDKELIHLPDDSDPRGWGPIHAWRALGQLHAQEAIAPLMELFHEIKDNDWVIEEMPDVFALIGPAAFPALAAYLRSPDYPAYSRLVASTSLMQMALVHPEMREQSIAALTEQLVDFQRNTPGVNGVLIANLVELGAVEQAELIQKVFSIGKVDRFIVGDWRDVKQRLRNGSGKRIPSSSLARDASSVPPDPSAPPPYQEPKTRPRPRPDSAG